ncbi:MAG: UDP-N-acetylmuramate--L-alanine ligase [bacterium]
MTRFTRIERIHFVGIGGIGMSGIAELLLHQGYEVTGSDLRLTEVTRHLEGLGAVVHEGHAAEHVEGAHAVVYSSAVKPDNPEVVRGTELKIPVIRRAEMLGELMRMHFSIGVAGTHGKTTTTSMTGGVLAAAGLDPTLIVGGKVNALGTSASLGEGDYLVAEADEFDRSFLRLFPTVAVITNVEAEHLDTYGDYDSMREAFAEFANKVPFYGAVVACLDDAGVRSLLPVIDRALVSYGVTSQADVRARDVRFEGLGSRFEVSWQGEELGTVELQVPGLHNIRNALAALGVGLHLDLDRRAMLEALRGFTGVARRFEVKGEAAGVAVVDDYAHHPTEVAATLQAARAGYERRIVAVFQPHLYTRTRDFAGDFGAALLDSDVLVVTDVYPAREAPIPGVSGELVASAARSQGHRQVHYVEDAARVSVELAEIVREGDLVITMGAGSIWKAAEELLRLLEEGEGRG